MTAKKKIGRAVVGGILVVLALSAFRLWKLREPMRAKITETNMLQLMDELDTYQPDRPDGETFRSVLAKYGRLRLLKDGWGRPLVIERTIRNGQAEYTVISLGRDGRRGPCCKPRVYSWDDNAVLSGHEWVQVWSSRHMRDE